MEERDYKDPIRAAIDDDDDDDKPFGSSSSSKKTDAKSKTPVLDTYSRDLTKMAEENKLDPIVGREKEIERVSQILAWRTWCRKIFCGRRTRT
jgi:ATP-dependent Clp protease ATP-binding subunit ClpC